MLPESALSPSPRGLDLIKGFEGFRSSWYRCEAGKWTIGYGHVKRPWDGFNTVTEAQAHLILAADLAVLAKQLGLYLTRVPTRGQADALLSLAYNLGVGVRDGVKGDLADSTLLAAFNAGNVTKAGDEFLRWCHYRDPATGQLKVSDGLYKRRVRERGVFLRE